MIRVYRSLVESCFEGQESFNLLDDKGLANLLSLWAIASLGDESLHMPVLVQSGSLANTLKSWLRKRLSAIARWLVFERHSQLKGVGPNLQVFA